MRRWVSRTLLGLGVLVVALLVAAVVATGTVLRTSLPPLDGRVVAAGLAAPATLERDVRGSVTLTAATRADLAYALGYAHAQDRWFQMDLLRRAAAGELAALLGPATLDADRDLRVHRFRAVAREALAKAPAEDRAVVDAYARGANAGLASLGTHPWEYWLLRATPEPWAPEDSLLVIFAMFVDLQRGDQRHERQRGLFADTLPPAVAQFLYAPAPEWDAALDGTTSAPPRVPTADEYDLRRLGSLEFAPPPYAARERSPLGSNNWAIAGRRTASGTAMVVNDMHLGLRVPNTWYHARLRQVAAGATVVDVTGVTLPGAPALVAGSTGRIAWAFTNSYADFADFVIVEPDPTDARRYLAADGPQPYATVRETIEVSGAAPVELEVRSTRWGPIVGEDHRGRPLALAWTAHRPEAVNLELMRLETAPDLDAALASAARAGIPGQNFVVGDASGRIAWTVIGRLPARRGDGAVPRPSTAPDVGFDGWLAPERRPTLVDPADGQIWTANSRVVGGEALAVLGDGGYDRGARSRQIADGLRAAGDAQGTAEALRVLLDDRALFLARWKDLLVALLDERAAGENAARAEARRLLAAWTGRAAVDDPAYRLVRTFRSEVQRRAFYALVAPARTAAPQLRLRIPPSFEGPLWRLVAEQPAHLLPPGHADWRAFLLASLDGALDTLGEQCPQLDTCTWGAWNTTRIAHPLSAALPFVDRWLDMPATALPGDNDMPRVQGRSFGASERFAILVGREGESVFHMPGGQSGHPLSPFHRSWHAAWERGEATPFLPGAGVHRLELTP
ncbi:MAG: penicillin acylase family protein [Pseudomonadota bacterium]